MCVSYYQFWREFPLSKFRQPRSSLESSISIVSLNGRYVFKHLKWITASYIPVFLFQSPFRGVPLKDSMVCITRNTDNHLCCHLPHTLSSIFEVRYLISSEKLKLENIASVILKFPSCFNFGYTVLSFL